jgi:ATP-binding cassette, subfamily G (WHITE), eye pigment precursor transporter
MPVQTESTGYGLKQILKNASGYAKPGECVAILGPSGSGKTSLLNVLSGRINLSKGSIFTGDVVCNGGPLNREDFGKFAAFVQQHDIMFQSMTPREAFIFAQKIRTSVDSTLIKVRAE